jgi:hypothetical protein
MKRSVVNAAALVAMLSLISFAASAQAQGSVRATMSPGAAGGGPTGRNAVPPSRMSPTPMGHVPGQSDASYYSDDFGGFSGGGNYGSGNYGSGYCSDCEYGECDDCEYGCEPAGRSWLDCCGLGSGQGSRWFFTADYLYVRASFSEAIAYYEEVDDGIGVQGNIAHELNFEHQSSYRIGGGYRLNCCDEEVRFMFTRLSSGANTVAPQGSIVPYEVIGPDGPTFIDADVDVKSFDLDFRKTIPLGGAQCCECSDSCDPCGCGDACCAPSCPAWDITWSGGLRFADVDWNRYYVTNFSDGEIFRDADSSLDFKGGGPRVGLEGRRYFGKDGWCSAYLKGDISILLGQMHQEVRQVRELGDVLFLEAQGRRIIPVTELEAGGSIQLTKASRFSAGYLFSAWHDLGFRDQFELQTLVESQSDDANILGFDGLFVRLEVGY